MESKNHLQLWVPRTTPDFKSANNIESIVKYSDVTNLTVAQETQIVLAFNAGAYDMATEYTWNKSLVRLKEMLSGFGGDFIGAMLKRKDIDEYSDIVSSLSDFDAISLSENIGILSTDGAMHLRHAKEELNFYFSSEATSENKNLDSIHAKAIILDCVKYILSVRNVSTEIGIEHFRDKLLNSTLSRDDKEYKQIIESSLFYLRTICNILLSAIENSSGGQLDNSITNFILIIDKIWPKLSEDDKWAIGNAYRNVYSAGNEKAASGLRQALKKVKGFDFVPENLRSETFIAAAKKLLEVHYEFNNFYNEPNAAKSLASLGTIIPKPAFMICMKAYLCILMGNYYGVSNQAIPIVKDELRRVSKDRWEYYFNYGINKDDDVLRHVSTTNQIRRLGNFLNENDLDKLNVATRGCTQLYEAIISFNYTRAEAIATKMYYLIRGIKK